GLKTRISDFGCRIAGALSQGPALAKFTGTPEIRHPLKDGQTMNAAGSRISVNVVHVGGGLKTPEIRHPKSQFISDTACRSPSRPTTGFGSAPSREHRPASTSSSPPIGAPRGVASHVAPSGAHSFHPAPLSA